jgi:hypothetical protein
LRFPGHGGLEIGLTRADTGPGGPHRSSDDLLPHRVPLGVVGIEKAVGRRSANRQGELPAKVVGVLYAGIHPLGTGRRMNVGRVAGNEHPPDAVPIHQPVADPKDR